VELPDHGVAAVDGGENGQQAGGVEREHLAADGRVGATLQEQADHLDPLVQDRQVQSGIPEEGGDVGVLAAVEEPAHDLGPAVLAGVGERLGHDLLRIVSRRDPGRDREEAGGVGAGQRGVGP
jgi:hypothetical protein